MKQLKKDLQMVSKSLQQLMLRTEKIAKKLGKLEKAKPVKKPKTKASQDFHSSNCPGHYQKEQERC